MKISVAQTKPVTGDIQSNIERHKVLIDRAVSNDADLIVFPELSLTGYEPERSEKLATTQDDQRFDKFQKISDSQQITIGVGVPTQTIEGTCISMLLFQPNEERQTYSKKYLHADENSFFVSGQNPVRLIGRQSNIALAICYEISVPKHVADACNSGASIYIASVAKFEHSIDKAIKRLSQIASDYSMTVLMSNSIGRADGHNCAGKTSIWNVQGSLVGQLNDSSEGILMIDTDTQQLIKETI